jgi:hypothetical protein
MPEFILCQQQKKLLAEQVSQIALPTDQVSHRYASNVALLNGTLPPWVQK